MARRRARIGRAELKVLHCVHDRHPVTVRQVADQFANEAGLARTTVLTVMERLRRKGYLRRRKVGGIFQYSPRIGRSELVDSLVQEFVDEALGGSVSPFVAYLARATNLSDEQLEELKQLVAELDRQRKEEPR